MCFLLAGCGLLGDEEEDGVEVLHYESPSIAIDWSVVPEWSASVDQGQVSLQLASPVPGEQDDRFEGKHIGHLSPGEQFSLILQDQGDDLPGFVSLTRSLVPGYEGTYKPIRLGAMTQGTIYIDSWNLKGLVRGRITGSIGLEEIDLAFYADLSDGPAERRH